MPVDLTTSTSKDYAFNLMAQFGVDAKLIAQAKSLGVVADQNMSGSILIKKGGVVHGTVPVKSQALTLLKQGTLGPSSKAAFKGQFESVLSKAVAASQKDGEVALPPAPSKFAKLKPAAKLVETIVDIDDLTSSAPSGKTKLASATALYQSVAGTSPEAKYVVFAMIPGLNLAAKIESDLDFALRAEGIDLSSYKPELEGFGLKVKGGYASGHFHASSQDLLIKALGAVAALVAADVPFDAPVKIANMKKLIKEAQS